MKDLEQIIQDKKSTMEEALHLFDDLETVSIDFMKGRWQGIEIASGHPLNGLLQIAGWYGKIFIDANTVHPLLFYTHDKKGLFSVDPKHIPLGGRLVNLRIVRKSAPLIMRLLNTKKAKARLRMIQHRGKATAAMIYDEKPITDIFRKIDENRVMGIMDLKGDPQPYFFVLIRDDQSEYNVLI